MYVHCDGCSSSVLNVGGHPDFQKRIKVNQYTLDGYLSKKGVPPPPSVIKIDTQGAERLIPSHARQCLRHTKVVFAELGSREAMERKRPSCRTRRAVVGERFCVGGNRARFCDQRRSLYRCDASFVKKNLLKARCRLRAARFVVTCSCQSGVPCGTSSSLSPCLPEGRRINVRKRKVPVKPDDVDAATEESRRAAPHDCKLPKTFPPILLPRRPCTTCPPVSAESNHRFPPGRGKRAMTDGAETLYNWRCPGIALCYS